MSTQLQNRLRIAVCDDDPEDRAHLVKLIQQYLDKTDHSAAIDQFASGEALLQAGTEHFGLVFLDIYMEGMNGMDAARAIFENNQRTKLVFCSSSAEFGVQSYDVKAIGYLLKPAPESRIFELMNHFFHVYTTLRTITVKVGRVEEAIYVNDILWMESDRHNCIIHTRLGDITTRATFDQLRAQLPEGEFIQPIRYALVALRAVASLPSTELKLIDGTVIPITKEARATIKKAYMDYCWKKMYE
jgi:DNA-binding LytR/AlgR family response regulator